MSLTSYRAAPPRGGGRGPPRRAASWRQARPLGRGAPRIGGARARSIGGRAGAGRAWRRPALPRLRDAVPSALRVFTAEFGMGSGVWPLAVTTRLSRPPQDSATEDRTQTTGSGFCPLSPVVRLLSSGPAAPGICECGREKGRHRNARRAGRRLGRWVGACRCTPAGFRSWLKITDRAGSSD